MAAPLSYSAEEVRRYDRDRFGTALFAPAQDREALFSLYAFNTEVSRVRELVTEPLLGRIRLQWWRDAIAGLYQGRRMAHPVAAPLADAIAGRRLSREWFDRLLDARELDLEDAAPADRTALEAYAEGTSASLTLLALEVLGVRDQAAAQAAHHVGVAWALTGLLRAVPFHASMGRLCLPADLLAEHGVSAEDLLAGRRPPGLPAVAEALAGLARRHLAQARVLRRQVPRAALPALLVAPLAEAYLNSLRRSGGDLMDTGWSAPRPRPVRLGWTVFVGRY